MGHFSSRGSSVPTLAKLLCATRGELSQKEERSRTKKTGTSTSSCCATPSGSRRRRSESSRAVFLWKENIRPCLEKEPTLPEEPECVLGKNEAEMDQPKSATRAQSADLTNMSPLHAQSVSLRVHKVSQRPRERGVQNIKEFFWIRVFSTHHETRTLLFSNTHSHF